MASEKITAIVESVKTMTVLELKELVDTICEEFGVSAVAAAAPAAAGAAVRCGARLALLLLLRKRRPSSMSSWLMSALTRCRSSRLLRS